MNLHLTNRTNLNQYQTDNVAFLWDTKLTGFGIKINKSGRHKYIIQYRNQLNKTKRETLAPTSVITLADAKLMAKRMIMERLMNAQGQPLKDDLTLEQLVKSYLITRNWTPRTNINFKNVMGTFWADVMDQPIRIFTKQYVREWYFDDRQKQRKALTNQGLVFMSGMWKFAQGNDWIDTNVWDVINATGGRYPKVKRSNHLTPAELKLWMEALNARYGGPWQNGVSLDMIKLYLLTGLRNRELYNAVIKTVDETSYIYIAPEHSKNHKDHFIAVSTGMKPLLYLLECDLPADISNALKGLSTDIGHEPIITRHDLRRTCATLMAHLKVDDVIIKRALNHTLTGITEQVYIQRAIGDTADAFEAVSNYIIGRP